MSGVYMPHSGRAMPMATHAISDTLIDIIDDAIHDLDKAKDIAERDDFENPDPDCPAAPTDAYLEWLGDVDQRLDYAESWVRNARNKIAAERDKAG